MLQAFKHNLDDIDTRRGLMLGSFMIFVQTFFPVMTGRPYKLANAPGREPYQITMARALRESFEGKLVDDDGKRVINLMINIPPRYGKTSMFHYFAAWCFARRPDSNFLYISYEQTLAALQTLRIREILSHPEYQAYFGIELSGVSKAKDYFETTAGGSMFAAGSGGPITGRGAGLRGSALSDGAYPFGGAMIIDDIHKPVDVTSDTKRDGVIDWLYNTAQSRLNDPERTPIWVIGQKLHEADAYEHLRKRGDFKSIIIPAIDAAGNPLDPSIHTLDKLKEMQRMEPYNFSAQYLQNPQPSGGGIFKPEWFSIHDLDPKIVRTFITVDTAETDKDYNDATVFSFWGLYKIKYGMIDTGVWGLHWIDCREIRVEPKDLEPQFFSFYMQCMRHKVRPDAACIEKKSTGTTLTSILKEAQGLRIIEIERYRQNGRAYSKIDRFLECQSYLAARRISFTRGDLHLEMCREHCRKITANNSHANDDICFVAGTRIATLFGDKSIQDVKIGDYVITPFGIDKVKDSRITSHDAAVVTFSGLTGTPHHPVFSEDKFIPLDTVTEAVNISSLSFRDLIKWQYKKSLSLMASNINSWGRDAIILVSTQRMREGKMLKDFMSRFGNFIASKMFQKAMLFATRTGIALIITLAIWSVYRISNICRCIKMPKFLTPEALMENVIWQKLSRHQNLGMQVKRALDGIGKMQKLAFISLKSMFARSAGRNIQAPLHREAFIAKIPAGTGALGKVSKYLSSSASIAEKNSRQKETLPPIDKGYAARDLVQQKSHGRVVYNLTIETHGAYYANNILVSNCDTMQTAIQCALIEGILIPYDSHKSDEVMDALASQFSHTQTLRSRR